MKMLLNLWTLVVIGGLVEGDGTAFIQIYDFIPQNMTQENDPVLVLTPTGIMETEKYNFDMFAYEYMAGHSEPVNATNYVLTLERNRPDLVGYQHPFNSNLDLEEGDNAMIIVDESSNDVLIGTVIHSGQTPTPGLDQAIVSMCRTDETKFAVLENFRVLGSNRRCQGCKKNLDMKPEVVKDTLRFLIDDTNGDWDISVSYLENGVYRPLCSNTFSFGDGGVYNLIVKQSETSDAANSYQCYLKTQEAASDFWLPIWLPILLLIILILIIIAIVTVDRRYPRLKEEVLKLLGKWDPEEEKVEPKVSTRLNSLDTFRGLAITTMIFVNFGGGKYYFMEHAAWHGLAVADFVFPWFMFMVGVSVVLSIQSQLKRNVAKKLILKKVTIRFIKLFLIGIFLNTAIGGGVELTQWRIPGVLQRIGFTFFVCAVLEVLFIPRLTAVDSFGGERLSVPIDDNEYNECGKFLNDNPDIPEKKMSSWRFGHTTGEQPACTGKSLLFHTWPQWVIMSLFTGLWCAITYAMPIPGCPTGYLGPGGLADNALYPNCTGGAAGYVDRLLFGPNMYQHPTCKELYKTTLAYDPEGLLGSLMAILTVYSGVLAGHIIVTNKSSRVATLTKLLIMAGVTLVIGVVLCKGSLTGGWVPINKNLWTVSFVMVTSSSAFLILALLYFLIDFKGWCCGSPFRSAGKNPLFLYVGSYILYNYFPFNWATAQTHCALMTQAIVGTVMWILVGVYLDCKKKYYKI